jgi:hypothetical protein
MDTDQISFSSHTPRYEYIVSFGTMFRPVQLPEGLAVHYRSSKRLTQGDIIEKSFKAPIEIKPLVEEFRRKNPEIFRAKRFKVSGCLGEHVIFLSPL